MMKANVPLKPSDTLEILDLGLLRWALKASTYIAKTSVCNVN